ncbi:MAG TPA: DUF1499 domain-containing protein, partial [Casimicrobiaceae bacterium]|nr:DUF1499 domain-containing protein [Casimicrobiaceae bacterium]
GFGARFGVWDFQVGFKILQSVPYVGGAIAAVALIALFIPKVSAGRAAPLTVALVVAAASAAVPLYWFQQAHKIPPINDITTDMTNPPEFKAILALRANAPVPATYAGEATAKQQAVGYPDIRPAIVAMAPAAAFAAALADAQQMGWDIVASDSATGRIEATATTPWFGFKDDVVVRVTPADKGSRIDIRSVSRVGKGDLGANARRIRDYLAKLGG